MLDFGGLSVNGRVLAERWRLLSELGRGGMGSVWRAEHIALGTPAAVKLVDPAIAGDPEALARFRREAQAAATLRSPHVVQILDYGVDHGTPYIAMELMEGESLAQRLRRLGTLGPETTATVITHVARAVGKAHDLGIVHRDLKPDNIFIVRNDDDEVTKVLDFGIAKKTPDGIGSTATPETRTGAMLGTPYYMSPEQVTGRRQVDHRTDIWAMGVIAFECLTGRRPFEDETLGGLVVAICTEPVPVPSRVATVPLGFDEWFARSTERDASRRFQSARESAEQLRAVCGAEGHRPSHPGPATGPAGTARIDPRGPRLDSTDAHMPASAHTVGRPRSRRRSRMLALVALSVTAAAALVVAVLVTVNGKDAVDASPSTVASGAESVIVTPSLDHTTVAAPSLPTDPTGASVTSASSSAAVASASVTRTAAPAPSPTPLAAAARQTAVVGSPSIRPARPRSSAETRPPRTTRARLDSELGL